MPPTTSDRLIHILEAIKSIEDLMVAKTLHDFISNRHNRAILEREPEVISETSRKIPKQITMNEPTIDWVAMAALGNRLRHAYHDSDAAILYSTAVNDLPPLKAFVERILAEESKH